MWLSTPKSVTMETLLMAMGVPLYVDTNISIVNKFFFHQKMTLEKNILKKIDKYDFSEKQGKKGRKRKDGNKKTEKIFWK